MRLLALTLALLCTLASATSAPAQVQGRVVGVVFDSVSGAPVAQAAVSIGRRARVVTDAEGRFQLRAEPGLGSVLVQRIGYDQSLVEWNLAGDSVTLFISLRPARILLDELRVELDRLDRLVESAPYSVLTLRDDALSRSTATDMLQALTDRFPFDRTACNLAASDRACVSFRGTPTRGCVVVDESPLPGGLNGLRAYRPYDLGRIFVLRGGVAIVGYTRGYLDAVKRRGRWQPMDVNTLLAMCGQ